MLSPRRSSDSHSPGQSGAAQPRSAALGYRTPPSSIALKGRDRRATNASKTCETVRRKRPSANVTPHMADSLAFVFPVEARESSPSIHSRFAMIVSTSGSRSCRAPSGRWIFGGLVTQGGAPRLRRVALPWAMAVAAPSGRGGQRWQDSFFGLPRGRRVDWRFSCREIACTQVPSPKGEPRLTLVRTALSSAAVSGLLTRSTHRGERAMGQAESRRGSRSGSSSHRFSDPHVQSSACNRIVCVSETHRRKLLMPPSSVGCSTKCQWLGINW